MTEEPRPNPNPEEPHAADRISVERVINLLNHGDMIEDHGRLRWSSNYTTIVTVQDNELQTLAVYKPQRGERPLWDFPDGTLCYREVAAYQVSEALGWGIIAPTVLRDGPRGVGSVQLYIDHDPSINYFSLADDFVPQLLQIAAFDVIVNNADRKGGHVLLDGKGKLWGIDHGICFHEEPKLRTVIWDFAGQPIPEALLTNIQSLLDALCADGEVAHCLQGLINAAEMNAMIERTRRLVRRKTFPYPSGGGPSYPWPPV